MQQHNMAALLFVTLQICPLIVYIFKRLHDNVQQ